MRKFFFAFAILSCFCFAEWKKNKHSPPPDNPSGLPNATQEGKNTIGFLLNGKPWTPKGFRGTGNLSIDYDPSYNQGIFSIVAYDFSEPEAKQFIIGIRDSLNYLGAPITLPLTRESLFSVSYNSPCDYFNQSNEVSSSGSLSITKLDKSNGVISGTFDATLSINGCETVQITEGRFDMKF